jgi:DNA-binding CsgD family transcriptional regulator
MLVEEPRPDVVLLERDAELAAMQAVVGAAEAGEGRFVAFIGGAGTGKTALLAATRTLGRSAGLETISARGGELEGDFAFGVVRQLFEPLLAAADSKTRGELLGGAANAVGSLFGSEVAAEPQTSFAMLHGLYWLAANIAARQPTMLIVDDLHWIDEPSLRWLDFTSRRLEGLPLLVVAASRPVEEARNSTPLIDLLDASNGSFINLEGLGAASVGQLIEARLGIEPTAEFAAALHVASAGNPLYLSALLDAAQAERLTPTTENVARVVTSGSQTLGGSLSLRVDRAGGDATPLVNAAAVLGDGSDLRLVASLAGLELADAGDAATALVRAGLLRQEDPIEFTHPVIRTSIYERIGAGDRFRAHRAAAERLIARGAHPEQAAAHLTLTAPSADPFVCHTLRAAAVRASAEGSPDAAMAYLSRALEEPPSAADLPDVLAELGLAERLIDTAAASTHLSGALEMTDAPDAAAALGLKLAEAVYLTGDVREAIAVLQKTLARLDRPSDVREQLVARLINLSEWDPDLRPIATKQLASVQEDAFVGGMGTDALLAALAERKMHLGNDRPRAIDYAQRALESGRLAKTRDIGLFAAAYTLIHVGKPDAAKAALDSALGEARRQGDLLAIGALLNGRSSVGLYVGDLASADGDLAEARELADLQGMKRSSIFGAVTQLYVACERGDLDRATEALAAMQDGQYEAELSAWLLPARGRLRLEQRQFGDALSDFEAAGAFLEQLGVDNPSLFPWRSRAALALVQLGRGAEARKLAEDELARARAWGEPGAVGVSLQALAQVRQDRVGLGLLQEAVDILHDAPTRLEYARALVGLGSALRRANRRSEARVHLREAVELAQRCRADTLVTQANDELAATGAHRRTVLLSGVDSLTASELRVARLAAEDLSNKEIAQALFVTVKTVEVHLSRVYRKLVISSRRQLAPALGDTAASP